LLALVKDSVVMVSPSPCASQSVFFLFFCVQPEIGGHYYSSMTFKTCRPVSFGWLLE
jgi:hypothetical protein